MSWDIYGNPLRRGCCEVHPHVHEDYPCSVCMAERNRPQINRNAYEEFERLQYELAQQGDCIRNLEAERSALAAQVYRFVTAFNEGTNDDVILAAAEISEEVSNAYHLDDLSSEESKSEIARLKNLAILAADGMIATANEGLILSEEYEKLEQQNAALAAQVEELLVHGTALATDASMATGAMAVGSPVTKFCVEAVKRFNAAKAATPQQHLAEIRAEAGRAGFVAGFKLGIQTPKPAPDNCASAIDFVAYRIEKFANIEAHEYAEQIRQGEVK